MQPREQTMTTVSQNATTLTQPGASVEKVRRIISRHSFCTLATASAAGKPHVTGIQYRFVNDHLYFVTGEPTKKVRNIRQNPNVAVCIPVRQNPVGPPYAVQFQGTAAV